MENLRTKICYIASVDVTIKFILLNHIKFLKKEGYDVYAVCSSGKWIKDIEKEGIKVKSMRFKRKFFSPISDLLALIKLFFYLKNEKFDIVHTHTPKAALIGQLAAYFAGIPIIVNTIHGFYFQKNDSWLKRKVFILIEKIAARCSDVIFFVNKEDMATAIEEKICKEKSIRYFGGGIDVERFNPDRFSKDFILNKKKELGLNPNNKIIGIVARLVREKGYLDLFSAFRKVLKVFPKTTLLVVGSLEPEKKDAINIAIAKRYKIEEHTIFLRERADVDEIYSLIDIFVLPSYREGLGISLIEASSMKKPVVATNIRGCREAIDNGKTGILVQTKNSDELSKAIIYLFGNPKIAEQMGIEGREKVKREFDERMIFNRIETEYKRLIKEKI